MRRSNLLPLPLLQRENASEDFLRQGISRSLGCEY